MLFIQLVLAILRVYPFGVPRMSLFFTPLLLMMTIMSMSALQGAIKPLGLMLKLFLPLIWFLFLQGLPGMYL